MPVCGEPSGARGRGACVPACQVHAFIACRVHAFKACRVHAFKACRVHAFKACQVHALTHVGCMAEFKELEEELKAQSLAVHRWPNIPGVWGSDFWSRT